MFSFPRLLLGPGLALNWDVSRWEALQRAEPKQRCKKLWLKASLLPVLITWEQTARWSQSDSWVLTQIVHLRHGRRTQHLGFPLLRGDSWGVDCHQNTAATGPPGLKYLPCMLPWMWRTGTCWGREVYNSAKNRLSKASFPLLFSPRMNKASPAHSNLPLLLHIIQAYSSMTPLPVKRPALNTKAADWQHALFILIIPSVVNGL